MSQGFSHDYAMKLVLGHMPKEALQCHFRPLSYQVLRYSYYNPTTLSKASVNVPVVSPVICNLLEPKLFVRFWKSKTPRATVPKTTIQKNRNFFWFPESKIRSSWQIQVSPPTPDSRLLQKFLKSLFCRGVSLRPDAFHYDRSFFLGKNISHKNNCTNRSVKNCKSAIYNNKNLNSSTSRWTADTYVRK